MQPTYTTEFLVRCSVLSTRHKDSPHMEAKTKTHAPAGKQTLNIYLQSVTLSTVQRSLNTLQIRKQVTSGKFYFPSKPKHHGKVLILLRRDGFISNIKHGKYIRYSYYLFCHLVLACFAFQFFHIPIFLTISFLFSLFFSLYSYNSSPFPMPCDK
jgi:hypothetical protein